MDLAPLATNANVVIVEPWDAGSHALFLDQWMARTQHSIVRLGLAGRHWKWRMRSAPWEIGERVRRENIARPDLLFVSDYVDLPALFGELPASWASVPSILYFHENQLTYPGPSPAFVTDDPTDVGNRDDHFGFTNLLSTVRADVTLFNSSFHRDEFAAAAREQLRRLPRPNPRRSFDTAIERSGVVAPGIDTTAIRLGPGGTAGRPLQVLFNHRWEHDKDPLAFLDAIDRLLEVGVELELSLLGERFDDLPLGVGDRLERLASIVRQRGFLSRDAYVEAIGEADVVVSTARHEFFGMAVLEAMATGATPLLPNRLSYPSLLPTTQHRSSLYHSAHDLVDHLTRLAANPDQARETARRHQHRAIVNPFSADVTAQQLDASVGRLIELRSRIPRRPVNRDS